MKTKADGVGFTFYSFFIVNHCLLEIKIYNFAQANSILIITKQMIFMKTRNVLVLVLCALVIVFSGCSSMNNTTKGGLIGGGSGAALGSLVGNLAGNTAVGAVIGAAVGTGAGVLIGKKMDKAKAEAAAAVKEATVEEVQDKNGLSAVKVTFDSGILFATNKSDLSTSAKNSLVKFAGVLKKYSDIDVAIYGHTDATGTDAINVPLSLNRAKSVQNYLESCGVATTKFKTVEGQGSSQPVASNDTKEGRSQNRRVEVYMYASESMIQAAQSGTLQ